MARDHARIKTSILDDKDFTSLNSVQQITYFAAIFARDLSWAGVLPYTPVRFTRVAADISERKAQTALQVLEDKRFLVIDRDTAEILVRSYIRHDGIMRQPNVAKACARAVESVYSSRIQDVLVEELGRLLREDPNAKGWTGFEASEPDLFAQVKGKALSKGFGKG